MELLHDIITYENDYNNKKETEKMAAKQKKEHEKQIGEQLRKAAMERLSSMSDCKIHIYTTCFARLQKNQDHQMLSS